ncbi:MAG TPA: helix-turn-helix transcriptional regulator [Nocardioidaceae bacterium]|nr:helix-turn-helix transcriptional regulator [Nocardioidaceae bacterium]
MTNERLRGAIATHSLTLSDVAERIDVDPKTVERWVSTGRLPHRRHRWAAAKLLDTDEAYLWPETLNDSAATASSKAEIVSIYPQRCLVPSELWSVLLDGAQHAIDVLVYGGTFLIDEHPNLAQQLTDKADEGARVRFLLGDPHSAAVAARGAEEAIGEAMAARIEMTRHALRGTIGYPGVEIRSHVTTLYNSIFRFDEDMLVNMHIHGSRAPQNPVMHLRRVAGGHLFDRYLASLDRIFADAEPVPAG